MAREFESRICLLLSYRTIAILIILSGIFLVFSSNFIMNHEGGVLAKPGKDNPGKGHGKNKNNDSGEDRQKDKPKDKPKDESEDKPKDKPKDEQNKIQVETDIYKGFAFDIDGNNVSKSFNFAAVGDFGCSSNAEKTVDNVQKNKPELVLPLGDLSYQKSANCWFDMMAPLKNKIFTTLGYHDVNDGQAKIDQYYKSFELDKPYYSFDYGKVHFIVMASESNFEKSSEQYNFVTQDLEETSKKKDVNWIIVTTYNPFYTSPSKHTAEKDIRDIYHPMFEQYGVDLVLQAHNHNYQRTYPISFNPNDSSKPTVTNQFSTDYKSQTDGIVFAIVGTGGEGFYPLDGQASYTATQFDRFGFLNIDISNGNPHTKLTGTFYDNKGAQVRDQFTIEKEIKNNGN